MGTTTDLHRPAGATRRGLLGTAAGFGLAAAAGCDLFTGKPSRPSAPDPLIPLRDEALALAAAYDRATAAQPALAARLAPIAAAHRAHAAELTRLVGTAAPAASGAPTAPTTAAPTTAAADAAVPQLRAAEQQALKAAVRACRQAPASRAALLGSIAAARASHAEALR